MRRLVTLLLFTLFLISNVFADSEVMIDARFQGEWHTALYNQTESEASVVSGITMYINGDIIKIIDNNTGIERYFTVTDTFGADGTRTYTADYYRSAYDDVNACEVKDTRVTLEIKERDGFYKPYLEIHYNPQYRMVVNYNGALYQSPILNDMGGLLFYNKTKETEVIEAPIDIETTPKVIDKMGTDEELAFLFYFTRVDPTNLTGGADEQLYLDAMDQVIKEEKEVRSKLEDTKPNEKEVNIVWDKGTFKFDVKPQVIDGRTMVPLRALFESFGYEVTWNAEQETAVCRGDFNRVSVKLGRAYMDIEDGNGKGMYELDVPAMNIDGRLLVPLRAVSDNAGVDVEWDAETRTVILTGDVGSRY